MDWSNRPSARVWRGKHDLKWRVADRFHVYGVNKDAKIVQELDEIIEVIGKAQNEDGHLHTRIQIEGIKHFSNRKYHEMYNCGHLMTAA